jgi:hypothetical protein
VEYWLQEPLAVAAFFAPVSREFLISAIEPGINNLGIKLFDIRGRLVLLDGFQAVASIADPLPEKKTSSACGMRLPLMHEMFQRSGLCGSCFWARYLALEAIVREPDWKEDNLPTPIRLRFSICPILG